MLIHSKPTMRDINEAVLVPFNEAGCAEWKRSRGKQIIEKEGLYWQQVKKGFYQTSNLLSKCPFNKIYMPAWNSWGVRVALPSEDKEWANMNYNFYMLQGDDLKNFEMSTLSSNRRNQVRRSFKRCQFYELLDKQLLLDQGYKVFKSCSERVGRSYIRPECEFNSKCGNFINDGRNNHLVLVGLVGDKLAGYIEAYAVEGVAYLETANFLSSELSSYVSVGLHYHMIRICKESPGIHTLVHGQVTGNNKSLRTFKNSMHFKEIKVPAVIKISPLLQPVYSKLIKKKFAAIT